jgi:hypothetical protein
LLRHFNALFAVLVKQGSSGAGDPHGLCYASQEDGSEGAQAATLGGHQSTHVP